MPTRHYCDFCDKELTLDELSGLYTQKSYGLTSPSYRTYWNISLKITLTTEIKHREDERMICCRCLLNYLTKFVD